MSGVYIPGMEIPKRGGISIYIWSSGTVDSTNSVYQAISVPDHGRLGDLDKLESELHLCAKYQTGYRQQEMLGCCETIRIAPTIIPADKEE